ncbi:acyltransferase family protein [Sphingomonas sp. PB4P5]|uniref:acyltransferase family protein n=1 Tax=Parasphingomonas puruogangriensis TaxID=3096155 RepID=UPI002FC9293F
MSHEMLTYREDIDGIRAIAVVTVVGYHDFPTLIPGGFIGVDIFFVISGFLITGILVREQERSGRIDLANFYARRVRRLLPALLAMLLTTLAVGLWRLPAIGELQLLARSTLAALFFASNVFFALQPSGYFAAAPEMFLLLHTWTLAVEEQFYIVWPLLIPLSARLADRVHQPRRRALWTLFVAVFVISLILCGMATAWRPKFAFYLTPFRTWEFALGAILSLAVAGVRPTRYPAGAPLAILGLAAIAIALWAFDQDTPFPGWTALVPTIGAALLLGAGALQPGNAVARMMSLPPIVYIGRLSYGWYLWHWPVLALVRTEGLGQAHDATIVLAVLLSLGLSAISYHVVEAPIRRQSWRIFRPTPTSLIAGLAMLSIGAAAATVTLNYANTTLRESPRLRQIASAMKSSDKRPNTPVSCENYQSDFQQLAPAQDCLLGRRDARRILLLMGDSHGRHLQPMLDR